MDQFNIQEMTQESLSALESQQLVTIVMALKEENDTLKKNTDIIISNKYDERLERLQKEINKDRQYLRRDSIEIVGISKDVVDDDIQKRVH